MNLILKPNLIIIINNLIYHIIINDKFTKHWFSDIASKQFQNKLLRYHVEQTNSTAIMVWEIHGTLGILNSISLLLENTDFGLENIDFG